jgi:hypothetical protein
MKTLLSIRFKIFYLIILLFITASCEKSDDSQDLKDQIVGTWKSTNSYYKSYTFNDNNTFIDTTFRLKSDNPLEFYVFEIISGNYLIRDGQLTFSSIQLDYFDGQESEYVGGFSTTYDAVYNISFVNDILVLNQVDVFELVSLLNSGIIGTWNHNKLIAVYDKNLTNKFTGGTLHGIYDFKSDQSVTWQYETLYENITNTSKSSASYSVSGAHLTVNDWGLYDLNISFSKNKMVWLYPDRTFERH